MVAARYNRLILAVDLGTSGCKCALVGLDGVVHKWAFRPVLSTSWIKLAQSRRLKIGGAHLSAPPGNC